MKLIAKVHLLLWFSLDLLGSDSPFLEVIVFEGAFIDEEGPLDCHDVLLDVETDVTLIEKDLFDFDDNFNQQFVDVLAYVFDAFPSCLQYFESV